MSTKCLSVEEEVEVDKEEEQKQQQIAVATVKNLEDEKPQDFGWLDQALIASWGRDGRVGAAP